MHNRYYLPGGRLNPGEGVCEGAKRETLEEAGMKVDLEGVIKLDYVPTVNKAGKFPSWRNVNSNDTHHNTHF